MVSLLIIIIGVLAFVYGTLTVLGIIKTDVRSDSTADKKLLSEKNRYFIGRYWAGFQGIIAGVGFIALGLALHFAK
jgi:branched-subunit amino acid permease